jgi:hypothetical protein
MESFLEGNRCVHTYSIPYQYMNWVLYNSGCDRLVNSGMYVTYKDVFLMKEFFEKYLKERNE